MGHALADFSARWIPQRPVLPRHLATQEEKRRCQDRTTQPHTGTRVDLYRPFWVHARWTRRHLARHAAVECTNTPGFAHYLRQSRYGWYLAGVRAGQDRAL